MLMTSLTTTHSLLYSTSADAQMCRQSSLQAEAEAEVEAEVEAETHPHHAAYVCHHPYAARISNWSKPAGINATAALISANQPFVVILQNALMGIE
jgi:hypothetical protein